MSQKTKGHKRDNQNRIQTRVFLSGRDHIAGVVVCGLVSGAVDRAVKPKTIKVVFAASLLSKKH